MREALEIWAANAVLIHPETTAIGWFGSYVTGNWGVGSDVDLLVLVDASDRPFESRTAAWDALSLPVPADLFVYTEEEWAGLTRRGRFASTVMQQITWLYRRP